MTTTRSELGSVRDGAVYVAFEVGLREWTLAITAGLGVTPWVRTVASGDLRAVVATIAQARRRFGVPVTAPVHSCYEAGRDGFWIHRALTGEGLRNRVVDSASIEVNRRARRTKTDRLDALKLVQMLVRVCLGERGVWHEVRVPEERDEAARQVSRERTDLVKEQTRLRNQVASWLASWGCRVSGAQRRRAEWWTAVRDWRDQPLPGDVQARIARAETRRQLVQAQITVLDAAQAIAVAAEPSDSPLGRLVHLKGVATTSASILMQEGLVWRAFRNRREVGGLLGFAPAKYNSGTQERDQGISRAGNAHLQAVSIQLAWNWVRWQPASALTQWYRARFGGHGRARRIGIVAVARKLLIALWRYATTGVVPAGAQLKPSPTR
jgi:transposase